MSLALGPVWLFTNHRFSDPISEAALDLSDDLANSFCYTRTETNMGGFCASQLWSQSDWLVPVFFDQYSRETARPAPVLGPGSRHSDSAHVTLCATSRYRAVDDANWRVEVMLETAIDIRARSSAGPDQIASRQIL